MFQPSVSLTWWSRSLGAISSGALLAAAFEPLGWWWVIPIALAGYWLVLRGASLFGAGWLSLTFAISFFGLNMAWMRAVADAPYLGMVGLQVSFFLPLGVATAIVLRHAWWPLWAPSVWAVVEWWRSHYPFGGMPFGRLVYASADTPLADLVPYLGLDGVTLAWALLGAALAGLIAEQPTRRPALVGLAVTSVAGLLSWVVPWQYEPAATRQVAVVQGSVPGDGTNVLLDHEAMTARHEAESIQLAERIKSGAEPAADFVVWPENATAIDPFASATIGGYLERSVAALGVPVLVGAIVDPPSDGQVLNQGIVWDPSSGPSDRYTKRHPVPFGEYIPYRGSKFFEQFAQLEQIPRDMAIGTRQQPLQVADVKVADAICFDIVFDDVLRDQVLAGAELAVVQTSNAKFLYTSQQEQQFQISRVQAQRTGRWLVVASINGVSGVIDPQGQVQAQLPTKSAGHVVAEVGISQQITPAMRIGSLPVMFSFLLGAIGMALGLLTYRHVRESERGVDRDRVDAPSFLSFGRSAKVSQ